MAFISILCSGLVCQYHKPMMFQCSVTESKIFIARPSNSDTKISQWRFASVPIQSTIFYDNVFYTFYHTSFCLETFFVCLPACTFKMDQFYFLQRRRGKGSSLSILASNLTSIFLFQIQLRDADAQKSKTKFKLFMTKAQVL